MIEKVKLHTWNRCFFRAIYQTRSQCPEYIYKEILQFNNKKKSQFNISKEEKLYIWLISTLANREIYFKATVRYNFFSFSNDNLKKTQTIASTGENVKKFEASSIAYISLK
jgi:hypothetical protein